MIRLASVLTLAGWSAWASAADVVIRWDPVETAAGYRVYSGKASRVYDGCQDSTTNRIRMRVRPWNSFISVTAYTVDGFESELSAEIAIGRAGRAAVVQLRVPSIQVAP